MEIRCSRRSFVMAALAVVVAGCGDPSASVSPLAPEDAPARGPIANSHAAGALLTCEVTIESGFGLPIGVDAPGRPAIECSPLPDRSRGRGGPDHTAFASDTILERFDDIGFTYDTPTWSLVLGSGTMSVNIKVVNHIAKPLGTSDGVHAAANGTRVFVMSGPTVLVNGGLGVLPTVTVNNSTGTGTFTSTGQKYFQYSGIIKPDSASAAVSWSFLIVNTSKFNFQVGVDAITP